MVLYSKFTYGSQFSEEEKQFRNLFLGSQDIKQIQKVHFFRHPVHKVGACKNFSIFYVPATKKTSIFHLNIWSLSPLDKVSTILTLDSL